MKIQNILNIWCLKSQKKKKTLTIIWWIPKMPKNPTGAPFIIASKNICFTKQIFKSISNAFKLIYSQIENAFKSTKFLSNYNKYWFWQNSDSIIRSLSTLNKKLCQIYCTIWLWYYIQSYDIINRNTSWLTQV